MNQSYRWEGLPKKILISSLVVGFAIFIILTMISQMGYISLKNLRVVFGVGVLVEMLIFRVFIAFDEVSMGYHAARITDIDHSEDEDYGRREQKKRQKHQDYFKDEDKYLKYITVALYVIIVLHIFVTIYVTRVFESISWVHGIFIFFGGWVFLSAIAVASNYVCLTIRSLSWMKNEGEVVNLKGEVVNMIDLD